MEKALYQSRADSECYRLGKWLLLPLLAVGIWFAHSGYRLMEGRYACRFLGATGLPCPGCGGTHAMIALFRGHILDSLKFHPAVLYGLLAYLHFMGLFFIRAHMTKTIDEKTIRMDCYAYGLVAVILVQWVVKLLVILL